MFEDFRLYDPPPADATIARQFARAVETWADRPFLHCLPETAARYRDTDPGTWSYAEAAAQVDRLVGVYAGRGLGPGHRLALVMGNRPGFFLHLLALNALGVCVVPLVIDAPAQAAALMRRAGVTGVVAAEPLMADAQPAAQEAGLSIAPAHDPGRLAEAPPPPADDAGADAGPDALAALLFTSGTTGTPKACRLTNAYFYGCGARYLRTGGLCALEPGRERLITPLPVNHMNALAVSFMAMMMCGGCLIQLDRFHPREWWDSVRGSAATVLHYLGVMPAMLLNAPEAPQDSTIGDQVRFGFGAGVDPKHHEVFERRFGFPLVEAWAMTESGAAGQIVAAHAPRHVGTRCFGRADDDLAVRVVDEAGADVAEGAPGELLVRAAGDDPRRYFFGGYDGDPAATAAIWAGDWLHTGDIVRRGEDGSFYFVDRNKNIVRRAGENIAAVEVEGVLMQHGAVEAVAIAPVPDEIRGEEVMALVVPRDVSADAATLAAELVDFVAQRLAYFKAPGYLALIDALPKTQSEKIARGQLKTLCRDMVEDGRAADVRALKKPKKTA